MLDNFTAQGSQLLHEREVTVKEIISFARTLEPLLRDGDKHHVADRLQALMGRLDAHDKELEEFLKNRKADVLLSLLGYPPK